MEKAFAAGYDPALELATHSKTRDAHRLSDELEPEHLRRKEQDLIDDIVSGNVRGHYYMLLGPKVRLICSSPQSSLEVKEIQGTGKTTMIYDAMEKIKADGVAVVEAHPEMEVFRLRLGRALNYEYNEDTQTGLFQRRDPREGKFRSQTKIALIHE